MRAEPGRRIEIDQNICKKLEAIIKARHYRGSFTSFVESVLDEYADGLAGHDISEVRAVRGRQVVVGDKRKTA